MSTRDQKVFCQDSDVLSRMALADGRAADDNVTHERRHVGARASTISDEATNEPSHAVSGSHAQWIV